MRTNNSYINYFLGTADIDISSRLDLESANFPVQYTGECPIIASYNLTTPRLVFFPRTSDTVKKSREECI